MKFLLLITITIFSTACSESSLLLVNTLARGGDYTLTEDHQYGSDDVNKLDIYRPNKEVKGTVIFFYGGCWGACTTFTKGYYRFVGEALSSVGYIVVIPDYRQYPDVLFTQIMEDSVSVIAWVDRNIGMHGGVTDQVYLMGHSAGGHIAATLSVNEDYLGSVLHSKIRGFIGLAAPYDFIFDRPYLPRLFAEVGYEGSQPSQFIDGKEPPLLLLYGRDDKEVYMRNIVNMTNTAIQMDVDVEPHIYDGVNHVEILAALSIPYRKNYDVLKDISMFLSRHDSRTVSQ